MGSPVAAQAAVAVRSARPGSPQLDFRRTYRTGALVASGADELKAMYVVESGSVGIYRSGRKSRTLVMIAGPGHVFGTLPEAGLSMSMSTAVTLEPAVLSVVDRPAFTELVHSNPAFLQSVLAAAARTADYLVCRLEEAVNEPARVRIARAVLSLAVRSRDSIVESTHEVISQLVGVSRQTVSSELKSLETEKVVDIRRGRLQVSDMEALERIARFDSACPAARDGRSGWSGAR